MSAQAIAPKPPPVAEGRSAVQGVTMAIDDPRSHSRYRRARAQHLATYRGGPAACILCGGSIDTTLPGTHPDGPTIEHNPPIRTLRTISRDWPHLVALTADPSTWAGVAHRHCQDAQGAHAVNSTNMAPVDMLGEASRVW